MRVVVIGKGIVGASAAYHLSRRGVAVTVIDAGLAGQATEAGAGIVCPWVDHEDDPAWYELARAAARRYPERAGYARVGALLVAEERAELEPVRRLLEARYPDAPEMGEITEVPDPAALFPPLAPGLSALRVPGAARVDGRAVRDALLADAVAGGVALLHGHAELLPDGTVLLHHNHPSTGTPHKQHKQGELGEQRGPGEPHGRRGPRRPGLTGEEGESRGAGSGVPVPADAVIVAAGAWSGQVCASLGIALPVTPLRGQIVHAVLDGVDTSGWPIVLPRRGPYLLGFPGSRVVVGATREDAGFDARVTVAGLAEVLSAGVRLAPGLAGASLAETRSGLRPMVDGERPLIARLTAKVVVATGLSAYGLTAGPYAGMLATSLVLGETPEIDLTPYAVVPGV
ncbi:NAD(P)/FAD-dependent oxidoreductase [Nonomuraea sp. NPDC050790]|uniref:NAD(P)/FAD-dependent oxidoreductase n=1 Tax=Nonomuraea sp. NPDC050790 TaxID=3364371 RepID=UPI0037963478